MTTLIGSPRLRSRKIVHEGREEQIEKPSFRFGTCGPLNVKLRQRCSDFSQTLDFHLLLEQFTQTQFRPRDSVLKALIKPQWQHFRIPLHPLPTWPPSRKHRPPKMAPPTPSPATPAKSPSARQTSSERTCKATGTATTSNAASPPCHR